MHIILKSALSERLGLEVAIIQAPTAFTTAPDLVAAVSNAGGIADGRGMAAAFMLGRRQCKSAQHS